MCACGTVTMCKGVRIREGVYRILAAADHGQQMSAGQDDDNRTSLGDTWRGAPRRMPISLAGAIMCASVARNPKRTVPEALGEIKKHNKTF